MFGGLLHNHLIRTLTTKHVCKSFSFFELYNIKNKKMATVIDGVNYEKYLENHLEKQFPNCIKNEQQISFLLKNFNKNIDITKYRGIDLIIEDNVNKKIYAIQVKIGAKARKIEDCKKFITTLYTFRKYVKHTSKYKVLPIWYSSAELYKDAKKELKKEGVNIIINSNWNLDINKCSLFKDFISSIEKLK